MRIAFRKTLSSHEEPLVRAPGGVPIACRSKPGEGTSVRLALPETVPRMNVYADAILKFAGLATLLALIPGSDTILVLRTSLRFGSRAGMITASGAASGPLLWGTAAGGGVTAFAREGSVPFNVLTGFGAAYLAYLAVVSFRGAIALMQGTEGGEFAGDAADMGRRPSNAALYGRGLLNNLLNPKIGVFFLAIMPGLIPEGTNALALGFLMGLTQSIIGIAFLWTLAIAQEMARPWLQGRYFPLVVEITAGIAFTGFAILTAASLL